MPSQLSHNSVYIVAVFIAVVRRQSRTITSPKCIGKNSSIMHPKFFLLLQKFWKYTIDEICPNGSFFGSAKELLIWHRSPVTFRQGVKTDLWSGPIPIINLQRRCTSYNNENVKWDLISHANSNNLCKLGCFCIETESLFEYFFYLPQRTYVPNQRILLQNAGITHFELLTTLLSSRQPQAPMLLKNTTLLFQPWASCHICKITSCACAGNAGNVFPATAG